MQIDLICKIIKKEEDNMKKLSILVGSLLFAATSAFAGSTMDKGDSTFLFADSGVNAQALQKDEMKGTVGAWWVASETFSYGEYQSVTVEKVKYWTNGNRKKSASITLTSGYFYSETYFYRP